MKTLSPAMTALLASREFFAIDCYTLTLIGGVAGRFCAGDVDIVVGGNTFSAGGQTGLLCKVAGETSDATWAVGSAATSLTVNVMPRQATLFGLPFTTACRYGVLDGAQFRWDLAIMPTYGDVSPGLMPMFAGRIVEVDVQDQVVTLNVNSPLELLDQQIPRNLFQPGCVNTLYDSACTANPVSFSNTVTVASGSTTTVLVSGAGGRATGYFDLGKIAFLTGVNAGASRSVRRWTNPGTVVITPPLPQAPGAGDAATLFAGCDKTSATCQAKFANLVNFRGFPAIPVPETAI